MALHRYSTSSIPPSLSPSVSLFSRSDSDLGERKTKQHKYKPSSVTSLRTTATPLQRLLVASAGMLTRSLTCDGGVQPEITTASGSFAVGSQGEDEISAGVGSRDSLICDHAAIVDVGPEPGLDFRRGTPAVHSSRLCA